MTKQELMAKIDDLRGLLGDQLRGLITLRRNAAARLGDDAWETKNISDAVESVRRMVERMLFQVYHEMGENDLVCSCGQTYASGLKDHGWDAQGLCEDIEENGVWRIKLHGLDWCGWEEDWKPPAET